MTNETLRHSIYAGAIEKIPAIAASRILVDDVAGRIEQLFGSLHDVHERHNFHSMYQDISLLREELANAEHYKKMVEAVTTELGFKREEVALDGLRLRCVLHNGHLDPGASRAYAPHRDTWFGNPKSQINFWIPLHDVTENQTFRFYPGYFNKKLANSSEGFSYEAYMQNAGWQGTKAKTFVPTPQPLEEPVDENAHSFAAARADVLLFSAAHLHGTFPNDSGRTRFSLDFRLVHRADHAAGLGAPDPDNLSQPEALFDYR